jgi:phosphate transport system substrate-binding protein
VKRSLFTKGLTALAALGILLAGLLVSPPAAHAAPPSNLKVIAAAGSDTTEEFMNVIFANPGQNTATDNGKYNIKARFAGGATQFVPGDTAPAPAQCSDLTWYTGAVDGDPATEIAPDGSGAGRNYLRNILTDGSATNNGCVDIARSSGGPRTTDCVADPGNCDRTQFEYYAFGLDAVSVASPSLNAPAILTKQQVKDIYACNIKDWADVGGAPGPIQRYLPQSGSGTRSFFISEFLDGTTPGNPAGCAALKDVGIQENNGTFIAPADFQTAIIPYSAGNWINQANLSINPTLDTRGQARLISQTPVATFNATTANGSTTLTTALTNRFTAVNVGAAVAGAGIPAGTTIAAVAANGQTATLSNAATAGATVSVTVTSLASGTARWLTTGSGRWLPNAPNASNPRAPVREVQERLNNSLRDYVGIRYVYNVLDSGSPNYADARALVGFNNVAAGTLSPVCDGTNTVDVANAGFQPLPTTTPSDIDGSTNLADGTCRRFS